MFFCIYYISLAYYTIYVFVGYSYNSKFLLSIDVVTFILCPYNISKELSLVAYYFVALKAIAIVDNELSQSIFYLAELVIRIIILLTVSIYFSACPLDYG